MPILPPILAVLVAGLVSATTVPTVSVPSDCVQGFEPGSDTVLLELPYSYNQVLGVIGDFRDLTWSGNPPDTVSLNGTDNTVGTARAYSLQGIPTVETLVRYSRPPCPGPYNEVHNTALVHYAAFDVSAYIMYDGNQLTAGCGGKSTIFNMTAHFCATNATLAAALLHQVHLADARNVGTMLGGRNFSSCAALLLDPVALPCAFGLPAFGEP